MGLLLLATVTALVALTSASAHDEWNTDYASDRGPLFWGANPNFKECGEGKQQSPINIRRSSTTYKSFPRLSFTLASSVVPAQVANKGTAPAVFPIAMSPYLSGGPLGRSRYRVYNIHMHYGNYSFPASEHAFDGVRTTGEVHIVTYDTKYKNIKYAINSGEPGALAVLGILFEARNVSNIDYGINDLLDLSANITYRGDHYMAGIDFEQLVSDQDMKYYYVYDGSLTTPSCSEVVQWMVVDRIHYVSPEAVEAISGLRTGYPREGESIPIYGNTRPLQSLHGRTVYRTFAPMITDPHNQEVVESGSAQLGFSVLSLMLAAAFSTAFSS